jgi:hypothetical protein
MAIIGVPEAESRDERVLIITPGVPNMAPHDVVRRGEAEAELPRRASSVDGRNMSRGRSQEQLLFPETSARSWILGLEMNSPVGSR